MTLVTSLHLIDHNFNWKKKTIIISFKKKIGKSLKFVSNHKSEREKNLVYFSTILFKKKSYSKLESIGGRLKDKKYELILGIFC
jgi:hypothetical protein